MPWGQVIELLEKLDDAELRDWYSAKDVAHGWSRPVLAHQIKTQLHLREGAARPTSRTLWNAPIPNSLSRSPRIRSRSSSSPSTGTPPSDSSRIGWSSAS
ncbi:DUF1016 N-terminal domain-containing protein [Rhodococcus sp. NCIMB 12038]|uniref:DUF1016 N-terminal domain-containing protein n=1 Tax=Rhodococcus sp. NCIMB 12038 TaxID=933800 RepID=UPI00211B22A7|nr:DUF1016 N-terminal domain-containing protein [Rhodococcus sp. NCIMB 12038]